MAKRKLRISPNARVVAVSPPTLRRSSDITLYAAMKADFGVEMENLMNSSERNRADIDVSIRRIGQIQQQLDALKKQFDLFEKRMQRLER